MSTDGGCGTLDEGNDSDIDLEAELLALTGSDGNTKSRGTKKLNLLPAADLNAMVSESLKDVPSDDEVSVDENDADLLNELSEITGKSTVSGFCRKTATLTVFI